MGEGGVPFPGVAFFTRFFAKEKGKEGQERIG